MYIFRFLFNSNDANDDGRIMSYAVEIVYA